MINLVKWIPRTGHLNTPKMPQHWLLRVADGVHFERSQKYMRWGVNSKHSWVPAFLRRVRSGDVLWFIKGKSNGQAIGVATFTQHCPRVLGPLIAITPTDEDLGWVESRGDWDVEVHYKDLYITDSLNILTNIKSPLVGRLFNSDKCTADLPLEFRNIIRYSTAVKFISCSPSP
jgi:hypothetical protein